MNFPCCRNVKCPFFHPPAASSVTVPASGVSSTTNSVCSNHTTSSTSVKSDLHFRVSPIMCRYGAGCHKRTSCPFTHPQVLKFQRVKWVAPGKQRQSCKTYTSARTALPVIRASGSSNPYSFKSEYRIFLYIIRSLVR